MKAKRVIVQDIKHVSDDLLHNAALYANAIKSITIMLGKMRFHSTTMATSVHIRNSGPILFSFAPGSSSLLHRDRICAETRRRRRNTAHHRHSHHRLLRWHSVRLLRRIPLWGRHALHRHHSDRWRWRNGTILACHGSRRLINWHTHGWGLTHWGALHSESWGRRWRSECAGVLACRGD
jgi:hypothetical protein